MAIETTEVQATSTLLSEETSPAPATLQEKIDRAIAAADAKESATEPEPTEEKTEPEVEPEEKPAAEPGGDVAKAKKLMKSGDALGAIKELFGEDGIKALKVDSKAFAALRKEKQSIKVAAEQGVRASEARYAEAQKLAREVYEQAAPMIEARKLFDEGDHVAAFQKAFGLDINEFQRRALRQKQGEDPQVAKLRKELEDHKREIAQRDEQTREQQTQAQVQRQQAEFRDWVKSSVSELPEVPPAAARNQHFLGDVMQELRDAYDQRTNTTIPISEAVETVMAREDWAFLRDPSATHSAKQVQAANPAQPATKPKLRSLSQRNAAEAAPSGPPLRGQDLIRKFVKLHQTG